jgi:pentatricopeptide repeat protein
MKDQDYDTFREAAEELRGDSNCNIHEAMRRFYFHTDMIEAYGKENLWTALCDLYDELKAEGQLEAERMRKLPR